MSYKSTLFILISLLLMGCTGKQKSEDFIRPVKVGYALREQGANCEILSNTEEGSGGEGG